AGGLGDGARDPGRVRREGTELGPRLARVLRDLPARARRLPAPVLAQEPRPAGAALVLGLALVLRPRADLHERPAHLPGAPLRDRARRLDRRAREDRESLGAGLARVGAGRGDRV